MDFGHCLLKLQRLQPLVTLRRDDDPFLGPDLQNSVSQNQRVPHGLLNRRVSVVVMAQVVIADQRFNARLVDVGCAVGEEPRDLVEVERRHYLSDDGLDHIGRVLRYRAAEPVGFLRLVAAVVTVECFLVILLQGVSVEPGRMRDMRFDDPVQRRLRHSRHGVGPPRIR